MDSSKPQTLLQRLRLPYEIPKTTKTPKTLSKEEEEDGDDDGGDDRNIRILSKLKVALFNKLSAKYLNKNNSSISVDADQLKTKIGRRLQAHFPSFHTPTHPPYALMIQRAILELGEVGGSNDEAISDFIRREYEDLPWAHNILLRHHLGKLCESGELVGLGCRHYMFPDGNEQVIRSKRRWRRGRGWGRRRRVESRDEIEDVDGEDELLKLGIGTHFLVKELGTEGVEEGRSSCGGQIEVVEAEGREVGGVEETDELKDGRGEMIEEQKKGERNMMEELIAGAAEDLNEKNGSEEEAMLEVFDPNSDPFEVEENEMINKHCLAEKLQTEVIGKQTKLQEQLKASDKGAESQTRQQSKKRKPQAEEPAKTKTTVDNINIVAASLSDHENEPQQQRGQPQHQGPLLLSDSLCSHEKESSKRQLRGRPPKAEIPKNTDDELLLLLSNSQPYDEKQPSKRRGRPPKPRPESELRTSPEVPFPLTNQVDIMQRQQDQDRETPMSMIDENMTISLLLSSKDQHRNEQQQPNKLSLGRPRGRPLKVRQVGIVSNSEASWLSLRHDNSEGPVQKKQGKRGRKRKSDVQQADKSMSQNAQQRPKRRGRPPRIPPSE